MSVASISPFLDVFTVACTVECLFGVVCAALCGTGGNCLGVHAHAAPLERDNGCPNAMARIVIASCDLFPFLSCIMVYYVYILRTIYVSYFAVMREFAFSLRYMRHVTDTRGASAVRGVVSEE